jgi:hypothetical protein
LGRVLLLYTFSSRFIYKSWVQVFYQKFEVLGKIFQYCLLGLKACRLKFTSQLIGNLDEVLHLRSKVVQPLEEVANQVTYGCYLAQFEPKKVDEALEDET